MIAVDIREQLELCILYEYMIIDLDGQVRVESVSNSNFDPKYYLAALHYLEF